MTIGMQKAKVGDRVIFKKIQGRNGELGTVVELEYVDSTKWDHNRRRYDPTKRLRYCVKADRGGKILHMGGTAFDVQ